MLIVTGRKRYYTRVRVDGLKKMRNKFNLPIDKTKNYKYNEDEHNKCVNYILYNDGRAFYVETLEKVYENG